MELIYLDTETTGFGKCRLVEIAWKGESEREITSLRCKPPIPIDVAASMVHGIYDGDVTDLLPFDQNKHFARVRKMVGEGCMVAHNAIFDKAVLEREGIAVGVYIDTQKVAKKMYPQAPNHKLQGLREYLKLEVVGAAHSASGDVAVLIALFEEMIHDMKIRGTAHEDILQQMMVATLH